MCVCVLFSLDHSLLSEDDGGGASGVLNARDQLGGINNFLALMSQPKLDVC